MNQRQSEVVEATATEDPYETFAHVHAYQLRTSGIPESLWRTLYRKLSSEIFDGGNVFEFARVENEDEEEDEEASPTLIVIAKDGVKLEPFSDLFLIDHAWTTTYYTHRTALEKPEVLTRVASILDIPIDAEALGDEAKKAEYIAMVQNKMWVLMNYYSIGTTEGAESGSVWYLMDELGSKIAHSNEPNVMMVPFYYTPAQVAYSIIIPIKEISEGDEICRDYFYGVPEGKQRDAKLLALQYDDDTVEQCKESFAAFEKNLEDVANNSCVKEATAQIESLTISTTNDTTDSGNDKIAVFSNMSIVREGLDKSSRFEITEDATKAKILWLYQHITDFENIDKEQFVNQFPDEKHLTCKDLLAEALYNYFGKLTDEFLFRTYNMETQLPELVGHYYTLSDKEEDTTFIVKPWALSRGIGHVITSDLTCMIKMTETGPKIASKYLTSPALYDNVKFDLRYMVLLKSVKPLRLSIYKRFLTRFANKPFAMENFDDYEKHMTVMTFVPFDLKEVEDHEFVDHYEKANNLSWKQIEDKIYKVIIKTFKAVGQKMSNSDVSRALYGVDIILDDKQNPYLLEVNFSPNCDRLVKYHPKFFEEAFTELFTNQHDSSLFVQYHEN